MPTRADAMSVSGRHLAREHPVRSHLSQTLTRWKVGIVPRDEGKVFPYPSTAEHPRLDLHQRDRIARAVSDGANGAAPVPGADDSAGSERARGLPVPMPPDVAAVRVVVSVRQEIVFERNKLEKLRAEGLEDLCELG